MTIPFTVPLLDEILQSLDAEIAPESGTAAWREFVRVHGDLTVAVREDRVARGRFERLLTVDYEMSPEEIRACLEYVYSHLVSKYQGNLAEYLASRALGAWLSERISRGALGPETIFVSGDTLRERGSAGRWLKGADGLLVADQDENRDLHIVGVVEVKSHSISFARGGGQLKAHIERLPNGLRIGQEPASREENIMGFEGPPGAPEKGLVTCPSCGGKGTDDKGKTCKRCYGRGQVRAS